MGKPNHLKPAPAGPSRRDFFRRSGGAAVAVAAVLPVVGAQAAPALRFQHGVASGDPLADRVILWTRVTPPAEDAAPEVRWELAADPGFVEIVRRGRLRTDAGRDFTVKVDATGLRPATRYYYRFQSGAQTSPTGRTRTLPVGATARLRIAVASCSNHAAGYFNAYRRIADRSDLDLVLHLGDYLYEYGPDEFGSTRMPEPPQEILSLSDYRTRHAQYKRDRDLQEAHRQHPFICIWDDHEVANDSWTGGAQNHTEGSEGAWPDRVSAALQAYYEWMPVRQPDPAQPRREQRSFPLGDLAELMMLEERLSARSQQLSGNIPTPLGLGFTQTGAFADPARTMLGAEQEAWLAGRLRGSTARWKLIGQGVMFAPLKMVAAPLSEGGGVFLNPDQWDGYQPARDRLYQVLEGDGVQPGVDNVVILTGDIHSSWAADLSRDPNNPDTGSGGYDPATGRGSRAVEFICTSITSPGLSDPNGSLTALTKRLNPHFKFVEFNQRGYLLLDLTPERIVAEWWLVDTVARRSRQETLAATWQVRHGDNHLSAPAS